MSARRSRRASRPATPFEAYRRLETAMIQMEGSALIASEAVEGIGQSDLDQETARYTADRLLQADVLELRAAVDAMFDALYSGAASVTAPSGGAANF